VIKSLRCIARIRHWESSGIGIPSGSKDWKKIERKNKKRKIGYDIKKTILLLDAIKEQNRRALFGVESAM